VSIEQIIVEEGWSVFQPVDQDGPTARIQLLDGDVRLLRVTASDDIAASIPVLWRTTLRSQTAKLREDGLL
jgi:hypothetical protein